MNGNDLTRELQNTFPLAPELAEAAPDVITLIAVALAGINANRDVSLLNKELSAFRHMREKIGEALFTEISFSKFDGRGRVEKKYQNIPGYYDGVMVSGTLSDGKNVAIAIQSLTFMGSDVLFFFSNRSGEHECLDRFGWDGHLINRLNNDGMIKHIQAGGTAQTLFDWFVRENVGQLMGDVIEKVDRRPPSPPAACCQEKVKGVILG